MRRRPVVAARFRLSDPPTPRVRGRGKGHTRGPPKGTHLGPARPESVGRQWLAPLQPRVGQATEGERCVPMAVLVQGASRLPRTVSARSRLSATNRQFQKRGPADCRVRSPRAERGRFRHFFGPMSLFWLQAVGVTAIKSSHWDIVGTFRLLLLSVSCFTACGCGMSPWDTHGTWSYSRCLMRVPSWPEEPLSSFGVQSRTGCRPRSEYTWRHGYPIATRTRSRARSGGASSPSPPDTARGAQGRWAPA